MSETWSLWFVSICTVSLVDLHFLSYRRLIACSALMLSLIHGMFWDLCETTFVCSGACLPIRSSKTWLYWSTRPARDDAGSLNNSDFKMSLSNLSCRMFFNLQYANWAFPIGGFVVFIEQRTAKWSDIRSATCTSLTMIASLHMIQSMMLPFMCVGSATIWCGLSLSRASLVRLTSS